MQEKNLDGPGEQQVDSASVSFQYLLSKVDAVVNKIGLARTLTLLETIQNNAQIDGQNLNRLKCVANYLAGRCIDIYTLEPKKFTTHSGVHYREARMACYHLLISYTQASYSQVARALEVQNYQVKYGYNKYQEYLEIPQHYPKIIQQYRQLEHELTTFLSQLIV